MGSDLFIGVDVGTGSARAGVFDASGRMLGSAANDIKMWRPRPDFVEQSSDDIWAMVCRSVRQAMGAAGAEAGQVKGLGFDATCSLVLLDAEDRPVTVSPSAGDEQNVIVWMDHRAMEQTVAVNSGGHDVLKYVGGVISPEMQTPKLLWIRENLPESWKRAARFLDLPDFLTYRATGDDTRSLCTTVCKWTYLGHEERWDDAFFRAVGLGEFVDDGYRRIGTRVRPMGEPVGEGLTAEAAGELGLETGTAVGVSIIDAHAGGVGLLGAVIDGQGPTPETLERRLALIGGTSSCHMAVSRDATFVPGIWGPYFSAMIPGTWLTEGGQSATGALVDHVIFSHAAAAALKKEASASGRTVYQLLNARLERLAEGLDIPAALTAELHVLPYFHGNRSPRADATLRGALSGLRLSATADDLALQYLAAVQAVAYGTRHIIEEMNAKGFAIDTVIACGGGTKNPVFLREHADITGCRIVLGREPEAVLLGSAVLGATAAGRYPSVIGAMGEMDAAGEEILPSAREVREYHDRKYSVFMRMYDDFMAYRAMMNA
ncbi:MAG: FGGY-family carbohydrate kinase [Planctomycetota bacterium]|jgi:FGGY-family pentulose kinase